MEQPGVHLLRQETISSSGSSDSGLRGRAEKGSEGQHFSRDDGEGTVNEGRGGRRTASSTVSSHENGPCEYQQRRQQRHCASGTRWVEHAPLMESNAASHPAPLPGFEDVDGPGLQREILLALGNAQNLGTLPDLP